MPEVVNDVKGAIHEIPTAVWWGIAAAAALLFVLKRGSSNANASAVPVASNPLATSGAAASLSSQLQDIENKLNLLGTNPYNPYNPTPVNPPAPVAQPVTTTGFTLEMYTHGGGQNFLTRDTQGNQYAMLGNQWSPIPGNDVQAWLKANFPTGATELDVSNNGDNSLNNFRGGSYQGFTFAPPPGSNIPNPLQGGKPAVASS